jgi:prepilin-type N-terminal cleavage/methylation domain-containing protein
VVCMPLSRNLNVKMFLGDGRMLEKKGFTLIELMVVILIVAILAAVAIPILRGRLEAAKWSEGAAIAGTIKTAAKVCYAEDPCSAPTGVCTVAATLVSLGFQSADLTGEYFAAAQFTIDSYDGSGNAQVSVTNPTGLTGGGVLAPGTGWTYTP